MNVLFPPTIVILMLIASTLMDHTVVLVRLDILVVELFVEVNSCYLSFEFSSTNIVTLEISD